MFTTFDRLDERVAEIQALEHARRRDRREIAVRLERSFITPFDREDIHELSAASTTSWTASRRPPRRSSSTASRSPPTRRASWPASSRPRPSQLLEALTKLEQLKGAERAPQGGPRPGERGRRALARRRSAASSESGGDPLDVIKFRDLYMALEETIDAAEDAAEVIERIVAKDVAARRPAPAGRSEPPGARHGPSPRVRPGGGTRSRRRAPSGAASARPGRARSPRAASGRGRPRCASRRRSRSPRPAPGAARG